MIPAAVIRTEPRDVASIFGGGSTLRVVGLFAGIGGLELGLKAAGHDIVAVAENDPFASRVLTARLAGLHNLGDVSVITRLPACDLISCGFPCQDLSQAGNGAGIHGTRSRLVREVLRLIDDSKRKPGWLLFENVPFMLSLAKGAGMTFLTRELEARGYCWAYRVVDSRAFGLAQRRRRLFILASRLDLPEKHLFREEGRTREPERTPLTPCGFYWTEGNRGVGWAVDATPPLKGTSERAIISPPAVWRPRHKDFVTPTIEDAEALQGFRRGWTQPACELRRGGRIRWKLVGNAVSVPVATWLGRLLDSTSAASPTGVRIPAGHPWPAAAFGFAGHRFAVKTSEWPGRRRYVGLDAFLSPNAPLLSIRAATGFLARLERSSLQVPQDFLADLRAYAGAKLANGCPHQPTHGKNARPEQFARKGIALGALPRRAQISNPSPRTRAATSDH
jgi:DNA (cytosine-5)-methyltransferase 1